MINEQKTVLRNFYNTPVVVMSQDNHKIANTKEILTKGYCDNQDYTEEKRHKTSLPGNSSGVQENVVNRNSPEVARSWTRTTRYSRHMVGV